MRVKEIRAKRNGKSEAFPVHFGFNTQADFCEDLKIPIEEFDRRVGGADMRLADIRALAWHAFRNGHRMSVYKDTPFVLTVEGVGDLFDENPGLITELFKALADAQPNNTEGEGDAGNVTEG